MIDRVVTFVVDQAKLAFTTFLSPSERDRAVEMTCAKLREWREKSRSSAFRIPREDG